MKRIHKKTGTVLATIALLSSIALADGEMGGGGLVNYDTPTEKVVVRTSEDGQLVNGQNTANANNEYGINWLLGAIGEFLGLS